MNSLLWVTADVKNSMKCFLLSEVLVCLVVIRSLADISLMLTRESRALTTGVSKQHPAISDIVS